MRGIPLGSCPRALQWQKQQDQDGMEDSHWWLRLEIRLWLTKLWFAAVEFAIDAGRFKTLRTTNSIYFITGVADATHSRTLRGRHSRERFTAC